MKPAFQVLAFFLFITITAAGIFGIQELNLPKMWTAGLAAVFVVTVVITARPFMENQEQAEDDDETTE